MALMTDSRTATPIQWTRVLVEAGHLADAIADDLDEVQHVEVAVDLKPDGTAACQHADVTPLVHQRPGAQPGSWKWRADDAREFVT